MKRESISLLLELSKGERTLSELSGNLGISKSYASKLVGELESRSLVERRGRLLSWSSVGKATLLRELSRRFDLFRLLGGWSEKVLLALVRASSMQSLIAETSLSYETVRRTLNRLMEIGAVSEESGEYRIFDEDLKLFIQLLEKEDSYSKVESYAEILWTNGRLILKYVPSGMPAKGALTGFSRFSKYGVSVRTPGDDYVQPAVKVEREEVLIHALRVAKGLGELTLCGIFYLKNKPKLNESKLKALVQRFALSEQWAEMQEYLRTGELQRQNPFFPPWEEFVEKAQLYDLRLKGPITRMKPEDVLKETGLRLDSPTQIYLLGGENLRMKGLKAATKDIDLVVKDSKQFSALVKALREVGYKPLAEEYFSNEDRKIDPSIILVSRALPRIDIWTGRVAKKLKLLPTMQKRADRRRYGKLTVGLLSNEDVFLLKAVADREIELLDLQSLAQTPRFNWVTVWKTLLEEERETRRHYCLSLLQVLDRLAGTRKIKTPIQQKLMKHSLDYLIPKAIGSSKRGIEEIEKHLEAGVPRYQLRNQLEALVRQGVLRKTKDNRKVLYHLPQRSEEDAPPRLRIRS